MTSLADQHKSCPVAKTLKVISSKWTLYIIHNLLAGKTRFGELQKALPGISPKTLSQRLRELEKEGVVTKHVFAEIPLHVEYHLTEKGKSFNKVFKSLEMWGDSA